MRGIENPKRRSAASVLRIAPVVVTLLLAVSCGSVANVNQGAVLDRMEALGDPPGFARIGDVEVINEDDGIFRYEGGYQLTWRTNGESPSVALDSVLPTLLGAGYVVEPVEETSCTQDAFTVFLLHEPTWLGSARLTYSVEEEAVSVLASWDSREPGFEAQPLGQLPFC